MFEALSRAVRRALTADRPVLPPPPDPATVGPLLDALDQQAAAVDNAPDLPSWGSAVRQFQNALDSVAAAAYPAGGDPLSGVLARLIMVELPRTGAILVLAGVITNQGTPANPDWRLDYDALVDFITDPETLVNEQHWEDLFADVGHPQSGRLPAVLAGLLIMAPQAIIAIVTGNLEIAGPPPPPVRSGPGAWDTFRSAVENWISFSLPLGDPAAADPSPASSFDWVSELEPDLSATLAIRSDRRQVGNDDVTDFEMWVALGIDQDSWRYDVGSGWFVEVTPGITAGFARDGGADSWHGAFAPLNVAGPFAPARPDDPVTIRLAREDPQGGPDVLLGPPYDTRLEVGDLELWIKFREATPVFEIGANVVDLAAVLAPRWFRTFGVPQQLLREGLRFDLDLAIAYGIGRGLTLNLVGGLDILWYFDARPSKASPDNLVDFNIHSLRTVVEVVATGGQFGIRLKLTLHISVRFGPLTLVADGFGAWGGYWGFEPPSDSGYGRFWGLLPPTGAGLALEIGAVTGGGYLDFTGGPTDRYAGLLMLSVVDMFDVTAFGIHEQTPEGRTSFVAVLGVRFSPGIQLGYGFAITGVGGIVGVNRRFDTDALRERLTQGAVGNVLFAPDPVHNAPTILGDLDALFPPADGVHVGGPTGRLSWAKLIHLDLGLLFEVAATSNQYGTTGLTKIVLLGSAHSEIRVDDTALLHLQLDFSGFWDGPKKVVEFDASLVRSHIFVIWVLTGDAAFRLSYASQPYSMLTLGGFHPDFCPEPAQFPEMARLGVAYDLDAGFRVWLRLEFYFAVTTNSIQTGAMIEAGIKAGPLNAIGFLAFDALIQFSPFRFDFSFSAGFRIRLGSIKLAGVRVKGRMTGPGPITISGEFCIEILFFDICWSGSFDLPPVLQAVAAAAVGALLDVLGGALTDPASISGGAVRRTSAALREELTPETAGAAVLSPLGQLLWQQSLLPLDTILERYQGAPLADGPQALQVRAPAQAPAGEIREWFAPGIYLERTTAEQLSQATFDRLPAGLAFGFGEADGDPRGRNVTVISYLIPEQQPLIAIALAFPFSVVDGARGRYATAAEFAVGDALVGVDREQWVVFRNGAPVAATSQTDAHTSAKLGGGVAVPAGDVVQVGNI